MTRKRFIFIILSILLISGAGATCYLTFTPKVTPAFDEVAENFENSARAVLGEDLKKVSKTELAATLTFGDSEDNENRVYYHILKTTFFEGEPSKITGLHTDALKVLFPVDDMDSCDEMMIQNWPAALYKKDHTAFLCWTYSPEVSYVLEYSPDKISDSEIKKMAESARLSD